MFVTELFGKYAPRFGKSLIIQTSPAVKDMVRIEHLMKEDIYRVVVTSYSLILSLRVRIPARTVLHLWPIFYSLYCTLFFAVAALRGISLSEA